MTQQNRDQDQPQKKPEGRPDRVDTSPPQTDRSSEGAPDRQIAQERQQSTGLAGQS